MFILAVFFISFAKNVQAAPPAGNTVGIYYGSVEISKANLPEIENKVLNLKYTGEELPVNYIDNFYKDSGTVYYKIGENGTWSTEIPKLKNVGNYNLEYYVIGDKNHNNLGDENNPESITVKVEVSKDDWGSKIEEKGAEYYLADNGKVSAEVKPGSVIWLKEDSYGASAWYGLDNTQDIFEPGSRFWVRWLHAIDDKEEYDEYFAKLDEEHRQRVEEDPSGGTRLWIFLTGVTKPDGTTEYGDIGVEIPYYIQLGDDWDETDINALFISENRDEPISVQFDTVESFNQQFESINFPETSGSYARLLLKHFSPYAVYDEDWGTKTTINGVEYYVASNGTVSAEVKPGSIIWLKEDSYGTSAWYALDNTQNTFEPGSRFWVRWLSEDNGEEYQKYLENLTDEQKKYAKENKLWIFLTGVIAPDGKEYKELENKVYYYIQLGDDWDKEDINKTYIGDESVTVNFVKMRTPEDTEESEFARLELNKFASHAVSDENDQNSIKFFFNSSGNNQENNNTNTQSDSNTGIDDKNNNNSDLNSKTDDDLKLDEYKNDNKNIESDNTRENKANSELSENFDISNDNISHDNNNENNLISYNNNITINSGKIKTSYNDDLTVILILYNISSTIIIAFWLQRKKVNSKKLKSIKK